MGDFKAIETQEEFDAAISKRLDRKEREVQEKYKDYLSPEDADKLRSDFEKKLTDKDAEKEEILKRYADTDKTVSDLTKRAESAERSLLQTKVANESKLPYELSDRIKGDSEEDMKKDAEMLVSLMKPHSPAPAYSSTPQGRTGVAPSSTDAAYMGLLSELTQ